MYLRNIQKQPRPPKAETRSCKCDCRYLIKLSDFDAYAADPATFPPTKRPCLPFSSFSTADDERRSMSGPSGSRGIATYCQEDCVVRTWQACLLLVVEEWCFRIVQWSTRRRHGDFVETRSDVKGNPMLTTAALKGTASCSPITVLFGSDGDKCRLFLFSHGKRATLKEPNSRQG